MSPKLIYNLRHSPPDCPRPFLLLRPPGLLPRVLKPDKCSDSPRRIKSSSSHLPVPLRPAVQLSEVSPGPDAVTEHDALVVVHPCPRTPASCERNIAYRIFHGTIYNPPEVLTPAPCLLSTPTGTMTLGVGTLPAALTCHVSQCYIRIENIYRVSVDLVCHRHSGAILHGVGGVGLPCCWSYSIQKFPI